MSAEVLRSARLEGKLSRTALAKRAGVPTSTVSRIEAAQMEPTVAMLQRLTEAAGRRLRVDTTVPELPTLSALARHLELTGTGDYLDWTAVRRLLDELDQRPELVSGAIATAPRSSEPRLNALLAGLAEELAERANVVRPRWTQQCGPLAQPWHAPGTRRMVDRVRRRAPSPLRDRNIWIAADGLWHER